MKIVVINGIQNPHNSMTQQLMDSCLQGIHEQNRDAEIKIVKLTDTEIKFCIGCKACGKADDKPIGNCVHNDAMAQILEDMLAADRIILVSPIYDFTVSALMTRFLERTLPFCTYPDKSWPRTRNKKIPGKKGLILLVSDCPAPINWLIGISWHASFITRCLCRSAGCSITQVITAGGMRARQSWFDKFKNKAYQTGKIL